MTKSIIIALTVVAISASLFFFLSWKWALAITLGAVCIGYVVRVIATSSVIQMLWEAVRYPKDYRREVGEEWDY